MRAYAKKLFFVLFATSASMAFSAENAETYFNKELMLEMGSFGLGVARAYSGLTTSKKTVETKSIRLCDLSSSIVETGNGYELYWFSDGEITNTTDPFALKISKRNFRLPAQLVIGSSNKANVIEAFGKPASEIGNDIKYFLPGYAGDDTLIFSLKNGVVESVSWCWFFD